MVDVLQALEGTNVRIMTRSGKWFSGMLVCGTGDVILVSYRCTWGNMYNTEYWILVSEIACVSEDEGRADHYGKTHDEFSVHSNLQSFRG